MIAPIPPFTLYGIWDPEAGMGRDGDWMLACDQEMPPDAFPILAFTSRAEAEAAARHLEALHGEFLGQRPHYIAESLVGAPELARARFTGEN
jgi:hypothetical protein